jgi:hypothetical protein
MSGVVLFQTRRHYKPLRFALLFGASTNCCLVALNNLAKEEIRMGLRRRGHSHVLLNAIREIHMKRLVVVQAAACLLMIVCMGCERVKGRQVQTPTWLEQGIAFKVSRGTLVLLVDSRCFRNVDQSITRLAKNRSRRYVC